MNLSTAPDNQDSTRIPAYAHFSALKRPGWQYVGPARPAERGFSMHESAAGSAFYHADILMNSYLQAAVPAIAAYALEL